jgi:hypothetical protein
MPAANGGSGNHTGETTMKIDTELHMTDRVAHDLTALTANDIAAVGGGTGYEIPALWGMGITAGSIIAFGAAGGFVGAAGMVSGSLLNAWAESVMSNTRKSN